MIVQLLLQRKSVAWLMAAVVVTAVPYLAGASAAPPAAQQFKVGVARRSIAPAAPYDWRGDPKHALATLIWYPAGSTAVEKPWLIGPPGRPFFDGGRVAAGAALASAPAKFPLVVLSHGFGGIAANLAWLGEALAAHGYIAAAVNHPGNNAIDGMTVPGSTLWWLRARDLSAVIDGLLADTTFGPRIDPHRIGAAGHSAGGSTAMQIAGGIASHARFSAACATPKADRQCGSPPEFPDLVAKARTLMQSDPAYRAAGTDVRSYRDPRVRAVFAMAPGLAATFVPDSLARIEIPVAIVTGAADERVPVQSNAKVFAANIPNAQLTVFPAPVGHMVFAGICLDAGRRTLPAVCVDPPGVDRAALEAQTATLANAFFARHLP